MPFHREMDYEHKSSLSRTFHPGPASICSPVVFKPGLWRSVLASVTGRSKYLKSKGPKVSHREHPTHRTLSQWHSECSAYNQDWLHFLQPSKYQNDPVLEELMGPETANNALLFSYCCCNKSLQTVTSNDMHLFPYNSGGQRCHWAKIKVSAGLCSLCKLWGRICFFALFSS